MPTIPATFSVPARIPRSWAPPSRKEGSPTPFRAYKHPTPLGPVSYTHLLSMPSLLTGILNGILTQFDSVYVAVFGLYYKLQTFVNMPANGVIQGLRPIISYNYGAGETDRVAQTIRYGLKLILAIMLIGTLASLLIPGPDVYKRQSLRWRTACSNVGFNMNLPADISLISISI